MWANAKDTMGAAQTWYSKLPVAYHNSTWTADRAIEWLSHGREDAPFCAWVSFPDPHHPFDAPEPGSHLRDPAEVNLPPHHTCGFKGRPWWHEKALTAEPIGSKERAEIRKGYSRIPEQTDDQLREIIANTYDQIALINHYVGRILIALDELWIAEDTIVIYNSDHGDWLGDHGLILKGPMHNTGLLRVPMILPGKVFLPENTSQNRIPPSIWGRPFPTSTDRATADTAWQQVKRGQRPLSSVHLATYVFWFCQPAEKQMPTVDYERDGRIGRITLNRPDVMNAINDELPGDLSRAVAEADADPNVHVMVLAGKGRAFCAGYDLTYYAEGNGNGQATQDMPWDPIQEYPFTWTNTPPSMAICRAMQPVHCEVPGFPLP